MLSQQRVRRLLGMENHSEDFGIYGLGTKRSLKEYGIFSGVDFSSMYISAKAWNGWFENEYPRITAPKLSKEAIPRDILFVTAFHEAGREHWSFFRRDKRLYLEWFSYLTKLRNIKTVCYYRKDRQSELPQGNCTVRDFEREDTFFKDYYDEEKAITLNPRFREFIKERESYPEHYCPNFSMMTHAKANFIRRAARQYPHHSHYAWIDFGIVRRPLAPDTVFDWSRLTDDKIHFQVFAPPDGYPSDPRQLCLESPDALSASLFVIPRGLVEWYEHVYEEELKINHSLLIADDEQNIMLRLAQKYPKKISADIVDGWYDFFTTQYGNKYSNHINEPPSDRYAGRRFIARNNHDGCQQRHYRSHLRIQIVSSQCRQSENDCAYMIMFNLPHTSVCTDSRCQE